MRIAVCVDNSFGMMFNNRRQSKDRILIEDFVRNANGADIFIHPYSISLFSGHVVVIDERFLELAPYNSCCFVENMPLLQYEDRIEELTVYKWNRDYPASTYFDIDLSEWELTSSIDFKGSSHERITREQYIKKN